ERGGGRQERPHRLPVCSPWRKLRRPPGCTHGLLVFHERAAVSFRRPFQEPASPPRVHAWGAGRRARQSERASPPARISARPAATAAGHGSRARGTPWSRSTTRRRGEIGPPLQRRKRPVGPSTAPRAASPSALALTPTSATSTSTSPAPSGNTHGTAASDCRAPRV